MAQKRTTFRPMPANDSFDRIQTILDEKQRAIFLSEMQRVMPEAGIFDEPTRCFKFNLEWCKLVVGWLLWMADVAFWIDAQDESYSAIRQMLVALEGEPCSTPALPNSNCYEYLPYHSAYTYFPHNPYTEPDYHQNGYWTSPFVIAGINYPTLINDFGDIVVRFESFPFTANIIQVLGQWLPEIIFTCTGIGQAEIKLQNQPLGGRVGITVNRGLNYIDMFLDGVLDTGAIFVDLNQDVLTFPGDSLATKTVEINFDVDEIHEIHITFVPIINYEDPNESLLRFGGTFKGIHLCGLTPIAQSEGIVDIRINGCNLEALIDGVWVNKGSVLACVTAITDPMQNQINTNTTNITSNDNDITALQAVDTSLQSQITSNDNDILILQNSIATHAADIIQLQTDVQTAQNTADLAYSNTQTLNNYVADHENRIDVLEANISQNNGLLSDHEQRIVVLENAGGSAGGSGQLVKMDAFTFEPAFQQTTSTSWVNAISIPYTFTYENVLILVELKALTLDTDYGKFRIRISNADNSQDVAISTLETWIFNTSLDQAVSSQINAKFAELAELDCRINIDWASSVAGSRFRILAGQQIQFAVWEYSTLQSALSDYVNFDEDSQPYTLTAGQAGTVENVGNTGNALQGTNLDDTEYIEVEIDLGSQTTINSVYMDDYSAISFNAEISVFIDDVQIGTAFSLFQSDASWATVQAYPSSFPMSGQLVRIRMAAKSGYTVADIRLDNILINTA